MSITGVSKSAPKQVFDSLKGLKGRNPKAFKAAMITALILVLLAGGALALHFTMGMPTALSQGKDLVLNNRIAQLTLAGAGGVVASAALIFGGIKAKDAYNERHAHRATIEYFDPEAIDFY